MNLLALKETAQAMVANSKGLLAMDESQATCNLRFARAGIAQTVEMRRAYRELLLTAPGLSACISGVILHDETFWQASAEGAPLVGVAHAAGMLVGIKVDSGAADLAGQAGEKVTEGLDRLRQRLQAYAEMGARFAKWRAVFSVDDAERPSLACIDANAHALARYAALCQEAGLTPVVEPEVWMEGGHTLARCQEVTECVLRRVFAQLAVQGVLLEGMILKPNMVTAGLACATQNTPVEVAEATIQCLLRVVPAAVPGIAFLSGGQAGELASCRLNAMHIRLDLPVRTGAPSPSAAYPTLPWPLSFSFARALQHPALEIWAGQEVNKTAAQQALLHRARCHCAALQGDYHAALEAC